MALIRHARWSITGGQTGLTGVLRLLRIPLVVLAATLLGACEVNFTPSVEPLRLATLPPQPFGTPVAESSAVRPVEIEPSPVSPLDPAFDEADPWQWIAAIEQRWPTVDVVACSGGEMERGCTEWTAEELGLLYATLEEYIFGQYLTGRMMFIRTDDESYAGLHAGLWEGGTSKVSEIRVSDRAWTTPPAASLLDILDLPFRKNNQFQGTIAHELTHAAVWFQPELLDWWREAQVEAGISLGEGNWMVGLLYRWSYYDQYEGDPELYDDLVQGELFALTVGAVMYDPIWRTGH